MKLSEAIRCGADIVGDARGVTLQIPGDRNYKGDKPCGCAIGTALHSVGVRKVSSEDRFQLLLKAFPVAADLPLCPACNGNGYHFGFDPKKSPGSAVECLYENHKWTRKAIAEWVETIENKLEREKAEAVTPKQHSAAVVAPVSGELVAR